MGEDRRLAALEGAFRSWLDCLEGLPEAKFLGKMEAGTPRDLVARLIGWNRLVVLGAQSIMQGKPPSHYADFANGYARVKRDLAAHEAVTERPELLAKLAVNERKTVEFFQSVSTEAWNHDFGVRHPDGGPATVRRCLEELTRNYLDAADDVTIWLQTG